MHNTSTKFRYIYVVQAGFDFTPLKGECEAVKFLTTGLENYDQLQSTIEANLQGFDPRKDAIVSVGRNLAAFVAGVCIAKKFPNTPIKFGIYKVEKNGEDKHYQWDAL
jgi:hypothetical protein